MSADIPRGITLAQLPIDAIDQGPNVREELGDLAELVASIRIHGILEPPTVAQVGGRWTCVMGHRRLAAAKLAGKTLVDVMIRPSDVENERAGERTVVQLVENLMRRDLNALEEARAYRAILDQEPGLTQKALGERVGRAQSSIANSLALLGQPAAVQELVATGKLSGSHAKALDGLPEEDQVRLAKSAVQQDYSAHQLERDAKYVRDRQAEVKKRGKETAAAAKRAIAALTEAGAPKDVPVHVAAPWGLDREAIDKAVAEAGWTLDDRWGSQPSAGCDCQAFVVNVQDGKGTTVERHCISEEHRKAAQVERDRRWREKQDIEERQKEELRVAIAAALAAQPPHPTIARLLIRTLDSYTGKAWKEYAALSDEEAIVELAKRISLRHGEAYGKPVPHKTVMAALGVEASIEDVPEAAA